MFELSLINLVTETYDPPDEANAKEDKSNISILLVLYVFGNLAAGLAAGLQISNPSCLLWNFSDPHANCIMLVIQYKIMSIFWAPILDSLFGRHKWKSWLALVQIQYYMGIFLLIAGLLKNKWLLNKYTELLHDLNWRDDVLRHKPLPAEFVLVYVSVILSCLAATQDIVVNGWALTMLKRKNLCYTSTCSGIGQAVGFFCGYFLPVQLVLEKFKIDIFGDYLSFWGVTLVIVAILMGQYVPENDDSMEPRAVSLGVVESYDLLVKTLKLPDIKNLIMILLSVEISFWSAEVAFEKSHFNQIVPKNERFAIEFLFNCLLIFLPLIFVKIISSKTPLENYRRLMKYRLLSCAVITVIVYVTSYYGVRAKQSIRFYSVIRVIFHEYNVHFVMRCTAATFFADISDPRIGGTYMTLLTSFAYTGYAVNGVWSSWFIHSLNYVQCPSNNDDRSPIRCTSATGTNVCHSFEGSCDVYVDGLYVAPVVSTALGCVWFYVIRKNIISLQLKNGNHWHVET